MYRMLAAAALLVIGILWNCGLEFAHHSVAANFDGSKAVEVTGKVKEFAIRNPHSQITLEVTQPDGSTTEFFVEWSDKNALMRRTVPVDKLRVGDKVTIT